MRQFAHLHDLQALVGKEIGVSEWIAVEQKRIDQFAEATGDHQWIHVDPARAASGPFGSTIAHGFLTLSLLPRFFELAIALPPLRMGINYGLNKVRFPSPVAVGSRVRARLTLLASEPLDAQGVQLTWQVLVECEGGDKPVCVAESLARHYS